MSHRKKARKPAGKNFKMELYALAKNNNELRLLIISTYRAHRHNLHIKEMWKLMKKFPDFKEVYTKELMGRHLVGSENLMESLCELYPETFEKYKKLLTRDRILGCSVEVAIALLRKGQ